MFVGIEASHANKRERTGVEEYCFQIIQEFKKIIPSSERVVLYTNEPLRGGLEKLPPNWEVKVLRWPFKKFWSQGRLSLELFLNPPDVFFAPGQLLPVYCPKNSVTTVHDVAFRVFPRAYNFFGRMYLHAMQMWINFRSKKILTPSLFSKKEIVRLYPSVVEKKIEVIPLSFDRAKFTHLATPNADVLKKYGISKPYIITVGRLEEKKNTRRLVEAFAMLRQERKVQLVLVGKPRVGYGDVRAAIDSSSCNEDIHELGYVPTEEVVSLIQQADVFVFPSLYEGFGIPVLEAMAIGTPVVAASGGALEEIAGKGAVYCNPLLTDSIAKTIKHVLDDQELVQSLEKYAKEQVLQYSWEKTAESTWKQIAGRL